MSETRTRIKICGITIQEDARAAVDYGADALGFIHVPESPRYIGRNPDISAVLQGLPPFVSSVAVCLEPSQIIGDLENQFDAVQFYSDDWPTTDCINKKWIWAFRMKDASSLEQIAAALKQSGKTIGTLLLDTYHKDKLGGSGETFNWELAIEAKQRFHLPIILAGGLTPDNVEEAIVEVRPYAVDVSSGVEAEPGRKDHAKLKAFIRAVERANTALNR